MPEEQYQDLGVQYHVLPADDPLHALNTLREAAGLDDWRTMDSGLSGLGDVTNSPRHHRYQQYRQP
jgi:hypothetical protein